MQWKHLDGWVRPITYINTNRFQNVQSPLTKSFQEGRKMFESTLGVGNERLNVRWNWISGDVSALSLELDKRRRFATFSLE